MGTPQLVDFRTLKRQTPEADPRVTAIYNLKALSRRYRDQFYGSSWFDQAQQLFELSNPILSASTFKPQVAVPQFQQLMLMEAADLASVAPRVYIQRQRQHGKEMERDKEREQAFDDHWDWIMADWTLFMASLWSLFAGTGWIELNHDPLGDEGNGQLCLSWLHPRDVYPDPFARWQDPAHLRWSFVVIERMYSLDVIRQQWAAYGQGPGMLVSAGLAPSPDGGVLKPGDSVAPPIRTLWGAGSPEALPAYGQGQPTTGTDRVPGNICFVLDYSEHEPSDFRSTKVGETDIHIPASRFRYPYGRMIVEAGGQIMFDGENPWGGIAGESLFPVIPLYSMPPLSSIWSIPPWRFSGSLETLGMQEISQIHENIIRTNNAIIYVGNDTGIDTSTFGALPGEIVEHAAGSKPPTHVWGNPMPPHVLQQPQMLFEWSRRLQGYEAPRMGQASAGNVGAELQDAIIGEGRKLTRMRSLLLYPSLNLLSTLIYGGMCRFYKASRSFPSFNSEEPDETMWKPGGAPGSCRLDPGSVAMVSESAKRRMTLQLRQLGLISKAQTLEDLRYPRAQDAAESTEQEEKLAALSALRRR